MKFYVLLIGFLSISKFMKMLHSTHFVFSFMKHSFLSMFFNVYLKSHVVEELSPTWGNRISNYIPE